MSGVVGVTDLGDDDSVAGGTPAATAGQSVQAAFLAAGHRERRGVAAVRGIEPLSRGGDRVLAVEGLAGVLDGDAHVCAQLRVSPRDSVDLGEGTPDLLCEGGSGRV